MDRGRQALRNQSLGRGGRVRIAVHGLDAQNKRCSGCGMDRRSTEQQAGRQAGRRSRQQQRARLARCRCPDGVGQIRARPDAAPEQRCKSRVGGEESRGEACFSRRSAVRRRARDDEVSAAEDQAAAGYPPELGRSSGGLVNPCRCSQPVWGMGVRGRKPTASSVCLSGQVCRRHAGRLAGLVHSYMSLCHAHEQRAAQRAVTLPNDCTPRSMLHPRDTPPLQAASRERRRLAGACWGPRLPTFIDRRNANQSLLPTHSAIICGCRNIHHQPVSSFLCRLGGCTVRCSILPHARRVWLRHALRIIMARLCV